MNTIEIKMAYKKSTKGTHVYSNDESEEVTTVYIKRGALPGTSPNKIRLTIEMIDD